ncbi:MAG: GNAT family N-acetyltransferase [Eubacteriales bacterium]
MNRRLTLCRERDQEILLTYLKKDPVRNTFLIGDILNYGFDSEIQSVWADFEYKECKAVYLWFCNNLLIYSEEEKLYEDSMEAILLMKKPSQVMAKKSHLEQMQPYLESFSIHSKDLFALNNRKKETKTRYQYKVATNQDANRIYDFLQSGELAPLYAAKEMVEKRIETGEGVHYFMEEEGQIVAHINSAAATPYSVMIGGLFTRAEDRGKGYASFLVEELSKRLVEEGKTPCLISNHLSENNLFLALGFDRIGEFTTLEPKEKYLGGAG